MILTIGLIAIHYFSDKIALNLLNLKKHCCNLFSKRYIMFVFVWILVIRVTVIIIHCFNQSNYRQLNLFTPLQTTRTRDNSISSSQFVWKKNAHNYSDSQLFRLTIIIIPLLQLCWNFPRQAFIGNLLVAKILEKKIMISFFSPIY